MKNMNEQINELGLESNLRIDEIPKLDLYMDQVIQLFENKFAESKRNEDEKILTKTMINNYAKGKLFFPIKNKKYSKDHLLLISLIYQMKGALSIGDIKVTLDGINEKVVEDDLDLEAFYQGYLNLHKKNVVRFYEEINLHAKEVNEEVGDIGDDNPEYLEQILMISSLANISNMYRRAAEKLIDELAVEGKK
ncbi:DUF1836 domain-containing protein [Bacillus sp. CGMCC 1.16607]|uniref:DUF1836 domain-containing protein n=1 Tax=Bacillus sp. CGMCC 1.16607 TaxID=3351842 RepID=UPI003644D8E2